MDINFRRQKVNNLYQVWMLHTSICIEMLRFANM
jgi:hypothetical protein